MANAILKIGLTGDYPPFSFLDPKTNSYSGLDVDLATQLAQHFNQPLEIVPTTWATLTTDLQQEKFDIGMGGISVTPARAKEFLFSAVLFEDEKVAVFRCVQKEGLSSWGVSPGSRTIGSHAFAWDDKNILSCTERCGHQTKFRSFSDLDQPEIIVIENPGGTNERVARVLFKNARIHIHDNNQTIFTEILQGRADVMITDRIEAQYQKKLHPALCWMPLPEWPEKEPKAFLFRKSSAALCERVNAWLLENRISGLRME